MRYLRRKLLELTDKGPVAPDAHRNSAIFALELRERRALPGSLRPLSPSGDFTQPMITGCGSRVAYWGVSSTDTSPRIWVSNLHGEPDPQRVTDDEGMQGHPYWHPDGVRLVYFSSKETAWNPRRQFSPDRPPAQLRWIDTATGRSRQLTEGPYVDERPSVTPDGKAVVFVSNRSGRLNLWRVNEDGSGLTQLTQGHGPDYRPSVSPDGSRVAYFSTGLDGFHQIHVLSLATHESVACTWTRRFKWSHGPFWLYDGESLLVHGLAHGARTPNLWLVNLSNDDVVQLQTPGLPSASHGTMDRNGQWLVCDSRDKPALPPYQR